MIDRPTRSILQALTNLSRLPEWKEVDKLLAAELAETTERLYTALDEGALRKLQGRCKLLRELQDLVAQASDKLAKWKG